MFYSYRQLAPGTEKSGLTTYRKLRWPIHDNHYTIRRYLYLLGQKPTKRILELFRNFTHPNQDTSLFRQLPGSQMSVVNRKPREPQSSYAKSFLFSNKFQQRALDRLIVENGSEVYQARQIPSCYCAWFQNYGMGDVCIMGRRRPPPQWL